MRNGERNLEKYYPHTAESIFPRDWGHRIEASNALTGILGCYWARGLTAALSSWSQPILWLSPQILSLFLWLISGSLRSACSTWKAADHTLKHQLKNKTKLNKPKKLCVKMVKYSHMTKPLLKQISSLKLKKCLFSWSCFSLQNDFFRKTIWTKPGVGLDDPCGSLPT